MTWTNFSKSIVAAAFVAGSLVASTGAADAKTKIGIYFGVPFYDAPIQDGYLYEPDYGWYAPEYRPAWRRHHSVSRVSCGQAARELRNSGFRGVRAIECQGRTYTFSARKGNRSLTLSYDARTGNYYRI
jgi:hypothetical protein